MESISDTVFPALESSVANLATSFFNFLLDPIYFLLFHRRIAQGRLSNLKFYHFPKKGWAHVFLASFGLVYSILYQLNIIFI